MCSRLGVVLQQASLAGEKAVSRYKFCIVTETARVGEKSVSQYTLVYYDRSGSWLGKAVSRYKICIVTEAAGG